VARVAGFGVGKVWKGVGRGLDVLRRMALSGIRKEVLT